MEWPELNQLILEKKKEESRLCPLCDKIKDIRVMFTEKGTGRYGCLSCLLGSRPPTDED